MKKEGTEKPRARWFVIEPLCHGNGGWYGSKVWKSFPDLKSAKKSKPFWEEVGSPYDGHVINRPHLSKTTDPNDAIYVYRNETWEPKR